MGYDLFNHKENYESWKKDIVNSKGNINLRYIEDGLTSANSKLFIQYITDMEDGSNVSKYSKKGGRSPKTLNRLRSKIRSIMVSFQNKGINDISKITPKQVNQLFREWVDEGHTNDYAKRFKAFWNWWMKVNRKEGKLILDVCDDLNTSVSSVSNFVWISKKELDDIRKYFNEEKQLILMFCFDSIVRSPSELMGLKVENVTQKSNGEVWINIPAEISKTFGRRFNLVYCGEQLMKHLRDRNPNEPIFNVGYQTFTQELQKVARRLFDNKKSEGGDYYKNITLYDLRHSGAIHFRQLFQKTGQSLDSLRHRGGWTDFDMINYYTKLLGLDGHIDKQKTLLQEDKTQLEKGFEKLKVENEKKMEDFSKKLKMVVDYIAEMKKTDKLRCID